MKLITTLIAFTTCLLPFIAFADEPARQIRFEVLIVRVPEARAVELIPLLRDPASVAAAQTKITAMLGKDAELVDWPIVTATPLHQSVVENFHEMRYAESYDQPTVMVETPESAGPTDLQAPSAPDAAAPAKPAVQRIKVEGELKVLGGSASSFEMKLVGTSLQLHPAISANGKQIEVQVLLSHTAFTGWQKISMEMSPTHKVTVEQPNFQVIKTDRQITVIDGKPALLNLSKLVEPKGMFEISILTATIIDIGK